MYVFNWTDPVPFGWNSWGALKGHLDLKNVKGNIDFFHDQLPGFRSGNTLYIDLDSHWWGRLTSGGDTGNYSDMEDFVNYCNSKGFHSGAYWPPFFDFKGRVQRRGIKIFSYFFENDFFGVNFMRKIYFFERRA